MVARPYMSPYLAGIGVGLVLLLAFLIMGRGLGATGAYSTVLATAVETASPEHIVDRPQYASYLNHEEGSSPLKDWLVIEIAGVLLGGFLSALWARRFRIGITRGHNITDGHRLLMALSGGVLMGLGAKFARGCTSGQGLTGGALLSVGSWLFILFAFAAAYAIAPTLKRYWS